MSRFISSSPADLKRRTNRVRMRQVRKGKARTAKNRFGSRQKPTECCGNLRKNCRCFKKGGPGHEVAKAFQMQDARRVLKSLHRTELLTDKDIWDVPYIVEKIQYCNEEDTLWWLWGSAMTLRYYNSIPSIDLLSIPLLAKRNTVPDFEEVEKAVNAAYERAERATPKESKLHGGLYRVTTLKNVSDDGGLNFRDAPTDKVKRDTAGIKLAWQALPKAVLVCYQENPSRDFFKAALLQFQANLANLQKGMMGDYMVKLMLDVVVMAGAVENGTISSWPAHCPAYLAAIPKLYPGIPTEDWFLAFSHWHHFIGSSRGMSLAQALAQLCWEERRKSGVLKDCF